MLFEGYGRLLWTGTLQTIQIAVLSLLLAFVIGLLGAAAKLSRNRWLALGRSDLHHPDPGRAGSGPDAPALLQLSGLVESADGRSQLPAD